MRQPIVVSSECVADDFAELSGADVGEVIALDPTTPEPVARDGSSFAKRYVDRDVRGRAHPSADAYRSFAATDHLLHAVDTAGPDREAVRRTLEAGSRDPTGEAHYERWFEAPPARFAKLQAGKWAYSTTLRR
jgi:hypothetical protein